MTAGANVSRPWYVHTLRCVACKMLDRPSFSFPFFSFFFVLASTVVGFPHISFLPPLFLSFPHSVVFVPHSLRTGVHAAPVHVMLLVSLVHM